MALYAEGGHVAKRARVDYSTSPTPITTLQLTAGTTPAHLGIPAAAVTASSTANTAGPLTNNIPMRSNEFLFLKVPGTFVTASDDGVGAFFMNTFLLHDVVTSKLGFVQTEHALSTVLSDAA